MPKNLNKNKFADVALNLDFEVLLQEAKTIESLALAHVPNPQIFEGDIGDLKSISIEGPSFDDLSNLAKLIEQKKSASSAFTSNSSSNISSSTISKDQKQSFIPKELNMSTSPISILKIKKENKNEKILEEFTKEQKNLASQEEKLNPQIPIEVQLYSKPAQFSKDSQAPNIQSLSSSALSQKKDSPPTSIFSLNKKQFKEQLNKEQLKSQNKPSLVEPSSETNQDDIFEKLDSTIEQSEKSIPINIFSTAKKSKTKSSKQRKASISVEVSKPISQKKTKKSKPIQEQNVQPNQPFDTDFEQKQNLKTDQQTDKEKIQPQQKEFSPTAQDFSSLAPVIKPKSKSLNSISQISQSKDENISKKQTSQEVQPPPTKIDLQVQSQKNDSLQSNLQSSSNANINNTNINLARRLGVDLNKSSLLKGSLKASDSMKNLPDSKADKKLKNLSLQAQQLLQSQSQETDINLPDEAYLAYAKENIRWLYEIYKMGGISFDDFKKKVKEKMHANQAQNNKNNENQDSQQNNISSNIAKQKDKKFKK